MELRVGNKYRLGRKIGSGSFGDIYLGEFLVTVDLLSQAKELWYPGEWNVRCCSFKVIFC